MSSNHNMNTIIMNNKNNSNMHTHFHKDDEEQQQQHDSNNESFGDLSSALAEFYFDENDLRPGGEFIRGYTILCQYENTTFAGVTLKKTRNGHKAKSGVQLESAISPVRQRPGVGSRGK